MKAIEYKAVVHKNQNRIQVIFAARKDWNERMKRTAEALWSRSMQCWHIPDTTENRRKCGLSEKAVNNKIFVNENVVPAPAKMEHQYISEVNRQQLKEFLQHLYLKAYSPSTIVGFPFLVHFKSRIFSCYINQRYGA